MNEYNFVNDIKSKYRIDELESKTLEYRINGFIKACDMDLEKGVLSKDFSHSNIEYVYTKNEEIEKPFDLKFFRSNNEKEGSSLTLMGNYNDIEVSFTNFTNKDKNYNKINELPFRLSIVKNFNDYIYTMDIVTIANPKVKFIIRKNSEKMMLPLVISFYANILDFSLILKLVKSFVVNPELVHTNYSEIIKQKSTGFTNGDLIKGITNDESLDEPVKGFKKLIRSLFK